MGQLSTTSVTSRADRSHRALVVLLLTSTLCVAALLATGWTLTVVRSGSMSPAIETGDLLVSRAAATDTVRVGDVVTFDDPDRAGRTLTHRVVDVARNGRRWTVTTKGDANTATERWTTSSARVSRVVARVPQAGRVLLPLSGLEGRLGLVLLGAGALVCSVAWGRR